MLSRLKLRSAGGFIDARAGRLTDSIDPSMVSFVFAVLGRGQKISFSFQRGVRCRLWLLGDSCLGGCGEILLTTRSILPIDVKMLFLELYMRLCISIDELGGDLNGAAVSIARRRLLLFHYVVEGGGGV